MVEAFGGPQFLTAARAQALDLYLDYDGPSRRDELLAPVFDAHLNATQQSAVSILTHLVRSYDGTPAAQACRVPVAYIAAAVPMFEQICDLARFKAACPQLLIAKTLCAGHFSPLEVPEQINPMIERFLAVEVGRSAGAFR